MLLAKQKRVYNTQTSMVSYHQGPIYTNGALEFVFNKIWAYPPILLKGAGQIAGQFSVYQKPQLRVQLALTPASMKGAGQYAGEIEYQRLILEEEINSTVTSAAE